MILFIYLLRDKDIYFTSVSDPLCYTFPALEFPSEKLEEWIREIQPRGNDIPLPWNSCSYSYRFIIENLSFQYGLGHILGAFLH